MKKNIKKLNKEAVIVHNTLVENTTSPIAQIDISIPLPTTTEAVKIAHYTGDFGRVDINLLRDKVNEVIDLLNK